MTYILVLTKKVLKWLQKGVYRENITRPCLRINKNFSAYLPILNWWLKAAIWFTFLSSKPLSPKMRKNKLHLSFSTICPPILALVITLFVCCFSQNKSHIGRAVMSCLISMDMKVDTGVRQLGLPPSIQFTHHVAFGKFLKLSELHSIDLWEGRQIFALSSQSCCGGFCSIRTKPGTWQANL